jgi:hypothetical protein
MSPLDLYEFANIEASRIERETWELPAAVRARFAGHALSVGRADVAREFLTEPEAYRIVAEASNEMERAA